MCEKTKNSRIISAVEINEIILNKIVIKLHDSIIIRPGGCTDNYNKISIISLENRLHQLLGQRFGFSEREYMDSFIRFKGRIISDSIRASGDDHPKALSVDNGIEDTFMVALFNKIAFYIHTMSKVLCNINNVDVNCVIYVNHLPCFMTEERVCLNE